MLTSEDKSLIQEIITKLTSAASGIKELFDLLTLRPKIVEIDEKVTKVLSDIEEIKGIIVSDASLASDLKQLSESVKSELDSVESEVK